MKLSEKITEYKREKANADFYGDRWEMEPENAELETAFSEAYEKEFKLFSEITEDIVKLSNGRIDIYTARMMVKRRLADLENLINQANL